MPIAGKISCLVSENIVPKFGFVIVVLAVSHNMANFQEKKSQTKMVNALMW